MLISGLGRLCLLMMGRFCYGRRHKGCDIFVRAETPGCLRSRKGINVPCVILNTQLVTDRDREMIRFAQDNAIDFID